VQNLSGWVAGRLGHPVRGGDELQDGGVKVVVRKARRGHVVEAQITRPLLTARGIDRRAETAAPSSPGEVPHGEPD
jgi:hypothetical protein